MSHLNDEQLSRFIDRDMGGTEINAVFGHLQLCSECSDKLDLLKRVHSGLLSIKEYSPGAEFTNTLMEKLAGSIKRKKHQKYFITFVVGLFGFIILAVLGYIVSISSFDFSLSADAGKYVENYSNLFTEIVTGMRKYTTGRNITLIGSVLSMGVIISAYFFYNNHKNYKNMLK